jgi:glycyl-tRNA synthetase beta chain
VPLLKERNYDAVLKELAALRDPVDSFFKEVMVMSEDLSIRDNRLSLLANLQKLFLDVADISQLAITK